MSNLLNKKTTVKLSVFGQKIAAKKADPILPVGEYKAIFTGITEETISYKLYGDKDYLCINFTVEDVAYRAKYCLTVEAGVDTKAKVESINRTLGYLGHQLLPELEEFTPEEINACAGNEIDVQAVQAVSTQSGKLGTYYNFRPASIVLPNVAAPVDGTDY